VAITSARAARAEPADVPGPLHDGAVALEAGRVDEAIARFGQAVVSLQTERSWAWFDLCLAHYAAGSFGEAINACYRALGDPAAERRVIRVLGVIHRAIADAHLDVEGFTLPDPSTAWFRPGPAIARALVIARAPDAAEVGEVRDLPAEAVADPEQLELVAPDRLAALRGPAPVLPYAIRPKRHDYSRGYDLELKTGMLFYGRDTTPFVVGARGALRSRAFGSLFHGLSYLEYLQAVDGDGGIAAIGVGNAGESGLGLEAGLSVPWGRDDRRQHATFPGYTLSLHAELRLSYRRELALGWGDRISIEVSIAGGVNVPKSLVRLKDAFKDLCSSDSEPCPSTPDESPLWPGTHWMVGLSIGFGHRTGYPRYDHAEVWAPAGGTPP